MRTKSLFFTLLMLAMVFAGCEKTSKRFNSGIKQSLFAKLVVDIQDLDVDSCNNYLKKFELELQGSLNEEGTTTWTLGDRSASIVREASASYVTLKATAPYEFYHSSYAQSWALELNGAIDNSLFTGSIDETVYKDFQSFYDALENSANSIYASKSQDHKYVNLDIRFDTKERDYIYTFSLSCDKKVKK